MKRIDSNYRSIVGINSGLIGAGVFGLIPPTTSAMFHNVSTLGITLNSMKNLLPEQETIYESNKTASKRFLNEMYP